jgi:hypothetical protein
MEFHVTWSIDIEAESFEQSIEQARKIQLDPESIATHFTVRSETGEVRELELNTNHSQNSPPPAH